MCRAHLSLEGLPLRGQTQPSGIALGMHEVMKSLTIPMKSLTIPMKSLTIPFLKWAF